MNLNLNESTIPVFRAEKDAPVNFKSNKYFEKNGLRHNGVAVARVERGCFKFDLFDTNSAINISDIKDDETVSKSTNDKQSSSTKKETTKVKNTKKEITEYKSWDEVPKELETLPSLKKKGLRHNNEVDGVLKIDGLIYYLFDSSKTIKVDELPKFATAYKSVFKAPKGLKGITYFLERGIMHNGIVKGVYKSGANFNELYDIKDFTITNQEKYDEMLYKEELDKKDKNNSLNKNTKKSKTEEKLEKVRVTFTKDNVPSYLKTKDEIEATGREPRGSYVAKLMLENGRNWIALYDSQNTILKPALYWKGVLDKIDKNPEKYIILDTETTGMTKNDEVVQLSIIDLEGNILFNSYFNPTREFSRDAVDINSLTKDKLKFSPKWTDKWKEIKSILDNKTIIAYNSEFDERLIRQTCHRYNIDFNLNLDFMCALKYANYKCKYINSNAKLVDVASYLGLKFDKNKAHESLFDTYACLYIINPESALFKKRALAEKYFRAMCKYDPKNVGRKQRYEEGVTWLKENFKIESDGFKGLDLNVANAIVNKLESFISKHNLA